MQISIESDFTDDSVFHVLDKLNPLVTEQYEIANKFQLIEGLKELQINDNEEEEFMSDEFKQVLVNADDIKRQYEMQPRMLSYLWGIIADLYVDTAKIKGFSNVQQKMPILKSILNNYSYKDLTQFFKAILKEWMNKYIWN